MEMQLKDITPIRCKAAATVLHGAEGAGSSAGISRRTREITLKSVAKVLHITKPDDPVADAYRRMRDITCCNEDLPSGMAIAILEMVKAEIIRDQQAAIDIGND